MTYRLTDASVKVRLNDVVLTYTTEGTEPTRGAVLYSTTFVSEAGDDVRQIGFKLLDSRLIATFWSDHVSPMQYAAGPNVTPQRIGNTHTIVFPLEALGSIRAGSWHAILNVDGDDVDRVEGSL
ncbi:MAG: hypothetical protein IR158_19100 [Cellulomonas sp.]|uniref:hypothetical protein n=1 Tax=Cellulomonas sp. TaxID=40001 RepID=UPI0019F693B5|nr:hypothetical protein [Cellulomonas sp.]MBF0689868.1 hypothetical protein [Cellulomonas sp.]